MSAPRVSNQAGGCAPEPAQESDTALLQRAKRGDGAAFDALVLRHQQVVFAVALRMLGDRAEAEDVAQDAFVRAWRGLGMFRQEAKLSTWLIAITVNLCRNRRRWWARRRRILVASLDDPRETMDGAVAQEVPDASPSPSAMAERREREQQLLSGLQLLGDVERSVIILRDLQACSYEEIAMAMGCRIGTVKSRLSRARLRLRALLDGTLQ